jgi:hypothetical protein
MLVTVWKSCLQYKKMLGPAFLQRWAQLGDVLVRRTEPEGALPVPARDSSRARRFLLFLATLTNHFPN